jgi:hypothetical protein
VITLPGLIAFGIACTAAGVVLGAWLIPTLVRWMYRG